MKTVMDLKAMSREEKLRIMEELWTDLSQDGHLKMPEWHKNELKKTEERLTSGNIDAVDWNTAKNELRNRFK